MSQPSQIPPLPSPTPRFDQPGPPEWRTVPAHVIEQMVDLVAPVFQPTVPRPGPALRVQMRPLSFLPEGMRLFAFMQTDTIPPVTRFALIRRSLVIPLDGTRTAFEELDRRELLNLNAETVPEYVACVLDFLWAPAGRFRIVQSILDIPAALALSADEQAEIAANLAPVSPAQGTEEDGWQMMAIVQNEDALFGVRILVTPDGAIALTDEKYLMSDVPVEDANLTF
ncbi:MAG: hypothetical protein Alpg2KO_29620 [Alphaproteobacteria bacterium]